VSDLKNPTLPAVLVLHETIGDQARPDEVDTLVQVEQVSRALRELGWQVSRMDTGLDLDATLAAIRRNAPACVFNLVESLGGQGSMLHFVPAMLQAQQLPFTGCNGDAMFLSSQKQLGKKWMRLHNIRTPDSLDMEDDVDDERTWIVKSLWEHASFGLDDGCVIAGATAARRRIEECRERFGGEWFAEEYVDGREFNISVLEKDAEPVVLPIAEIAFDNFPGGKPRIVGYAAKWDESAPEYQGTHRIFPRLDRREQDMLESVARHAWSVFGLSGYARVDIRMDAAGIPWVLEVNANPCLSRDAGFAAAAEKANTQYQQVIHRIMQAALKTAVVGRRQPQRRERRLNLGTRV
jgi:D-alanine-D-alanine ligase